MWKMDPLSGFDIRLVFTLLPRDSTLQYKRCVHFWNNFPCITSLPKTVIEVLTLDGKVQLFEIVQFPGDSIFPEIQLKN